MAADPLACFDPRTAAWFAAEFGEPTAVQAAAWPSIAAGEHVLATAPTGSGKTLTAFLYALDRLLTGAWPGGRTRVLYVSPLKALNSDIRRNLLTPLEQLAAAWREGGAEPPAIGVETRSGDTPPAQRRRLLSHPPEILITTPESLNLLLTTAAGRAMLGGLQTVILDEIHAVAESKRGTHLMTAVERLVPLAGEFQRLALSATVKPLETMAEFVGGYRFDGREYTPRTVRLVRAEGAKDYATTVRFPGAAGLPGPGEHWRRVAEALRGPILANRSTLVFVNSRRLAELLTLRINDEQPAPLAYSHHGSLSRETRQVVEERLKRGELRAIVATGSLELGIDVGALDEVLLVESPGSVAQTLQRLGRAGHRVGQVSRGQFLATSGRDLLLATVMSRCVLDRDLEETRPLRGPLDVLAQVLLAMAAERPTPVDELFDEIRCAFPYRDLSRRVFDLVLEMLAGRYAASRLTALQPRVNYDRLAGTVQTRPEALRLVRTAGGTIPDRGYFTMRHAASQAVIGELDEEFVWERRLGDSFVMGSQTWRIEGVTHNDVLVAPARATPMAPFWRAEEIDREPHFSGRVAEFLEAVAPRLDDPALPAWLSAEHHLEAEAATALVGYLQGQGRATGAELPHRHHLLIERVTDRGGAPGVPQIVLHTFWGARLNRPFGLALAGAWRRRWGSVPQIHADNDCLVLMPETAVEPAEILDLVAPGAIEELLRGQLEASGYFGARFRENAARALLLTRGGPGQRLPLWLNRQRAKQLLENVAGFEDFPLLVETWRTCLRDGFDLPALRARLGELRDGLIRWTAVQTAAPSPFAANVAWRQTNDLMYRDDQPAGTLGSRLSDELLREVVFAPHLRPELDPRLVAEFAAKRQGLWIGYAPAGADETVELLKDRLLLTTAEWRELLAAIARDHGAAPAAEELAGRVTTFQPPGGAELVLATENLPRLAAAIGLAWRPEFGLSPELWQSLSPPPEADALADLAAGWLQFQGPVPVDRLPALLGLAVDDALDGLAAEQRVVIDRLTAGAELAEVCDADNLERLLRLARRAAAPIFDPRPLAELPLFLARCQGLTRPAHAAEALQPVLDALLGWPAPAAAWEADLLPARAVEYQPAWLDRLWAESDLLWWGCGPKQVTLAFPELLDLLRDQPSEAPEPPLPAAGRHALDDLCRGRSAAEVTAELWRAAWEGTVHNGSWAALRQAAAAGFEAPAAAAEHGSRRRAADRWRSARAADDGWRRVPPWQPPDDALEALERDKDRVRLLLDRWGVLARELLGRELPPLRWAAVIRAARLMELSGELVAGCFFTGLAGLQFTTPATLARLADGPDQDAVYWLNAADPASLCGLGLALDLPERRPTTYLVYHGPALVLTARRRGSELDFAAPPEAPRLDAYVEVLDAIQRRWAEAVRGVAVETINGDPARHSPYLPALRRRFEAVVGPDNVRLWLRPER